MEEEFPVSYSGMVEDLDPVQNLSNGDVSAVRRKLFGLNKIFFNQVWIDCFNQNLPSTAYQMYCELSSVERKHYISLFTFDSSKIAINCSGVAGDSDIKRNLFGIGNYP